METWIKDLKTNKVWKLDGDKTKLVYEQDGHPIFKLSDIGRFRFYPCDPDHEAEFREERCKEIERNSEGYQFDIFDFKEITNVTMA